MKEISAFTLINHNIDNGIDNAISAIDEYVEYLNSTDDNILNSYDQSDKNSTIRKLEEHKKCLSEIRKEIILLASGRLYESVIEQIDSQS